MSGLHLLSQSQYDCFLLHVFRHLHMTDCMLTITKHYFEQALSKFIDGRMSSSLIFLENFPELFVLLLAQQLSYVLYEVIDLGYLLIGFS